MFSFNCKITGQKTKQINQGEDQISVVTVEIVDDGSLSTVKALCNTRKDMAKDYLYDLMSLQYGAQSLDSVKTLWGKKYKVKFTGLPASFTGHISSIQVKRKRPANEAPDYWLIKFEIEKGLDPAEDSFISYYVNRKEPNETGKREPVYITGSLDDEDIPESV